ncbi:calcium/sodium antiporter [Methanotrichaceae archaeon M04Ac]|uniref:Calcium/sodium antiporter n=1 Tax=Candidatus Methanocrinis alkalitolerans TaxID=3033395 RepID=A0ABT5XC49_9EURY|nr:calcium/sodium antiporter [Candidatus Methanocrinis alkalitolerans]MCR3884445.1 calcium/sodium antiporter [Methanothrix sp.]MDF0592267.1 calcium/sodium antiporter [Candidatus Methanocrinis alkalitolerans]
MQEFLIFVGSLVALYFGAKAITDSAVHFAKVLGVSEFVIGATVVAFGTALPEFSTSMTAMLVDGGKPEIVAGNVLGSILANIGLALGSAAIFYGIYIDRKILELDLSFFLATILALYIVFLDFIVTWIEGIFLIAIYLSFIRHEILERKKSGEKGTERLRPGSVALFLAGMATLAVGAKYMVEAIGEISITLGISEAVVAVILLAVGTSLPEVSTAVVAAKNGRGEIAMGDIIGANTFNALIILGASSMVGDVAASEPFVSATVPVVVLVSLLLGFMVLGNRITRFEGSMLLAIYFLEMMAILTIL